MTCLLPAPRTATPPYQPPTIHTPHLPASPCAMSLSSLPLSAGSVRIGWAVCDSVPNRWALCMLAQTQSMVRDGKWRGRETERARVGEKEGERKKKLRSGLPVVVHSLPTFTRSSCFFLFFFFFFFFSFVRTTPPSLSSSPSL